MDRLRWRHPGGHKSTKRVGLSSEPDTGTFSDDGVGPAAALGAVSQSKKSALKARPFMCRSLPPQLNAAASKRAFQCVHPPHGSDELLDVDKRSRLESAAKSAVAKADVAAPHSHDDTAPRRKRARVLRVDAGHQGAEVWREQHSERLLTRTSHRGAIDNNLSDATPAILAQPSIDEGDAQHRGDQGNVASASFGRGQTCLPAASVASVVQAFLGFGLPVKAFRSALQSAHCVDDIKDLDKCKEFMKSFMTVNGRGEQSNTGLRNLLSQLMRVRRRYGDDLELLSEGDVLSCQIQFCQECMLTVEHEQLSYRKTRIAESPLHNALCVLMVVTSVVFRLVDVTSLIHH